MSDVPMTTLDERAPSAGELGLPKDLLPLVVSAVRAVLQDGLPSDTLRSGVRVTGFERYGGGMKSPLVGGLSINLGLSLKIGSEELDNFLPLFTAANATGTPVFPNVHFVTRLPGNDGLRLLVMDHLRGYRPLLDVVYKHDVPPRLVARATRRCLDHLDRVHSLSASTTTSTRSTPANLYFARIRAVIVDLARRHPWLSEARHKGMQILDDSGTREVPPLDDLISELENGVPHPARPPVVLHGDPHLGNLMVRRHGQGYAARLIDPNPTWGVGDYLYDAGKVFHFADICGPVRLWPKRVSAAISRRKGKPAVAVPVFNPPLPGALLARQRALLDVLLEWRERRARHTGEPPDGPRWHVAVATSTLVTAANLRGLNAAPALIACAVRHLCDARDAVVDG